MRSVAAPLASSAPAPMASQSAPAAPPACSCAGSPSAVAFGSSGSAIFTSLSSLYDHFFEQHVVHRRWRDGEVHTAQKLFLEAHHAGRAANVFDAQLAQISLELIDDAGQHRFDGRFGFRFVEFERDG